ICCASSIAAGPLRRMTARAPRPLGVESATIVFILKLREDCVTAGGFLRVLAGRTLWTDFQLAICAFTDRLGIEIFAVGKCQVNNSSLVGAHRFKRKWLARLSHSVRCVV